MTAGQKEPRIPIELSELAEFYSQVPYPWPPLILERPTDGRYAARLKAQDLGDFINPPPRFDRIWVAGCGTNQAAITALRFPESEILASDVATESLRHARSLVDELGISNVTLKEESIARGSQRGPFDYVLCTGVIHHNPDTGAQLSAISQALSPDGLVELMVYNEHHRARERAVQRAMKYLHGANGYRILSAENLQIIVQDLSASPMLKQAMKGIKGSPEAEILDQWRNPYESPFSVQRLKQESESASMRILAPFHSRSDDLNAASPWFLDAMNPSIRQAMADLDDTERWQIAQDLGFEKSPMLWFYLCKARSQRWPTTEMERITNFRTATFKLNDQSVIQWRRSRDGSYLEHGETAVPPRIPAYATGLIARSRLSSTNGSFKLALDRGLSNAATSQIRWALTTGDCPPLLSNRTDV